jgi:predicted MFS family arabinose efflux permease
MKIRNNIAAFVGLVVSIVIILAGETISFKINPLPESVDLRDLLSVKAYFSSAPTSLHLVILGIYAIGCFIGGVIASLISTDKKMPKAMTVGGILLGFGIYSLINIGHPMWVVIASVFVFLPFAYFGGLIGIKFSSKKK